MILEITWSLLALGGLVRAIHLARESVIDRRALGKDTNGRRLLADWQVEHAFMGVAIYFCLLSAGLSALAFRFDLIPLHLQAISGLGVSRQRALVACYSPGAGRKLPQADHSGTQPEGPLRRCKRYQRAR